MPGETSKNKKKTVTAAAPAKDKAEKKEKKVSNTKKDVPEAKKVSAPKKANEGKKNEKKVVEKKPAEKKVVEKKAADKKVVGKKTTEKKDKKADKKSAAKTVAQKQPAKEAGKKVVAKKPVAKKPKKKPPTKGTIPKPSTQKDPLIVPRPKNYSIGNDIQPPRNLYRYVRWPHYIKMQRQKRVLMKRLKVPPALNILNTAIPKKDARSLFRILHKYRTEEKSEVKKRRLAEAKNLIKQRESIKKLQNKLKKSSGKDAEKHKSILKKLQSKKLKVAKKGNSVISGVNQVTRLIERGKAKLIVIAHDVDPVEMVVFLPYLCRKKEIPFCVVKGKARLGKLVHRKTATCLAITDVNKQDTKAFADICDVMLQAYNKNTHLFKTWGGNKKPRGQH